MINKRVSEHCNTKNNNRSNDSCNYRLEDCDNIIYSNLKKSKPRNKKKIWFNSAHKTEYMCYNQTGDISTLDWTSLKLVEKCTYLGSSVSSTEKDIDTRLTKAWTAIDRLSIIWKSDLTDKMKRSFFQTAVVSILLYGCTTWTLTKRLEKKLDDNYKQYWTSPGDNTPQGTNYTATSSPITKTIQVRRTRHEDTAGEARTNSSVMYSYGPPLMAKQKQDYQFEHTYSSYVKIRDVALKTRQRR